LDSVDLPNQRELQLLSEVDRDPDVTQRQLAQRIGIALGLTNVLLRNLVQRGYVRVAQASWKRRIYTLTPEGFFHRVGLMRAYIHRILADYQKIRGTLREELEPLSLNEESRVAIYGTGEFAELVYLGLREIGIEEIDIFSSGEVDGHRFLGLPVRNMATLQPDRYDRVVMALLTGWEKPCGELRKRGASPRKLVTFFADGKARVEG
jgi:hypothetical protein